MLSSDQLVPFAVFSIATGVILRMGVCEWGLLSAQAVGQEIAVLLPEGVADWLRARFRFYDWDAARREVHWVCGFDTTEEDVDAFTAALRAELASAA